MSAIRLAATYFLGATVLLAWHDPVHSLVTRAAIESLSAEMRRFWGTETDPLIARYCLYPDE